LMVVATLAVAGTADLTADFHSFKGKFGKAYATKEEEAKRFAIFQDNAKKAAELAKTNPLAKFGVNTPFADLSAKEFKQWHNGEKAFEKIIAKRKPMALKATPVKASSGSVDWRQQGAVTPVKNQGQCGSCWSFSTTGNIEGQWKLAGHPLVALSEQELVSCDHTDDACNGGLMDNAFEWLINNQNGWITSEADYPYVSGQGNVPPCALPKPHAAQITGKHDIQSSEDAMATYCQQHGPVSIGVDATSWQTYEGGIMTNCISQKVDHGVLIVGFDDNHQPPYWIIKNSWTATWGESGYIRVEKGTDQCLITTAPSSSIASSSPVPPPGPTPPSPNPPGPTPPPPSPSGGSFTQYVCEDSSCQYGCQKQSFQTDTCLQLQGGGSVKAFCRGDGYLTLHSYTWSNDCSGSYSTAREQLNVCEPDQSGTYVLDQCGGSGNTVAGKEVRLPTSVVKQLHSKKH